MSDGFLNKAYAARSGDETRALYDAWASSYEAEVGENGYVTPGRVAEALYSEMPNAHAPILDFGCGTGLSGLALKLSGYELIDGMDLSEDMLALARQKNVYRNLQQVSANAPSLANPGDYAAIAAIGVIGAGAASIAIFDTLMAALDAGGLLAFSFNDHALADPANEGKVNEWTDRGAASLRFKEHGPHLPGIGLNSTVYIIEKT